MCSGRKGPGLKCPGLKSGIIIGQLLQSWEGALRGWYMVGKVVFPCPVSGLPSPFSGLRSPVSRLRSPFSCLPSPFSGLRSPFSCLRSPFSGLRSPFSCLRSPFSCLRSPVSGLRSLRLRSPVSPDSVGVYLFPFLCKKVGAITFYFNFRFSFQPEPVVI
jgi:hypothetical protein